jgi:hypothetical protein
MVLSCKALAEAMSAKTIAFLIHMKKFQMAAGTNVVTCQEMIVFFSICILV